MSFPKKGKVFPVRNSARHEVNSYASTIAEALRRELGSTHRAIQVVVKWTGASERTVKNWFAGTNGPSGEHLIALISHSDETLETILYLAGRKQAIVAKKLSDARQKLGEMIGVLETLMAE